MAQTKGALREKPQVATRNRVARSRRWRVVLLNDDYTSMDFVVMLLESIFHHSPAQAVAVMMKVHKEGRGIAGVFPHDVAETKVLAVHQIARAAGYPLRAEMEAED